MDVITTSLEALIQRITSNPNNKLDTAATDAFCVILGKETDGVQIGTKLLATYIQSTNENEALQALNLLDTCMKRCGQTFHAEVGKFRFLNEMIKLVSPKYLGNKTPAAVREKVLKLLCTWIRDYPREVKIKEAYEMLKKQGVVKDEASSNLDNKNYLSKPHKGKNTLFEDEETAKLLQELLQSKDPFELQLANRLIKSLVKDDERRVQQTSQRNLELESALNNVRLLSEMLDSYNPAQTNSEDIDLIKELYQTCERFKLSLLRLADETQDNEDVLVKILTVNDELSQVFDKYATKINPTAREQDSNVNIASDTLSLLDLSENASASFEQLDEKSKSENPQSDMEMLNDIFSTPTNNTEPFLITDSSNVLIPNTEIMQPITISLKSNIEPPKIPAKISTTAKALEDLDEMGKTLLQQSLLSATTNSVSKKTKNPSEVLANSTNTSLSPGNSIVNSLIISKNILTTNSQDSITIQSLSDINITLEDIKPSIIPPMTVIDEKNGVSVILHFADGHPRPDVSVIVVKTMTNKALSKYLFQAVVPKVCKCRLLQPSATELSAHNPFLPPSAITQIMLIANPQKVPVSLKFMLSFVMDEETITEMGEVEALPLA